MVKTAGRPPKFRTSEVVDASVRLFWSHGFDGTSLDDIEKHLNINRSSLYRSFGGKAGLYDSAVDSYIASMEDRLVKPLVNGSAGLADLMAFVGDLRALLADPDSPAGCLVVNAMGSGQPPEATEKYLHTLHAGFEAALSRAADLGEISAKDQSRRASSVLTQAIGLNVVAKAGASSANLDRLFEGVVSTISGWEH